MQDYHARPLEVIHTLATRLESLEVTDDADMDQLLTDFGEGKDTDNEEVMQLFDKIDEFWTLYFEPYSYNFVEWLNDLKSLIKEVRDGKEQGTEEKTS